MRPCGSRVWVCSLLFIVPRIQERDTSWPEHVIRPAFLHQSLFDVLCSAQHTSGTLRTVPLKMHCALHEHARVLRCIWLQARNTNEPAKQVQVLVINNVIQFYIRVRGQIYSCGIS